MHPSRRAEGVLRSLDHFASLVGVPAEIRLWSGRRVLEIKCDARALAAAVSEVVNVNFGGPDAIGESANASPVLEFIFVRNHPKLDSRPTSKIIVRHEDIIRGGQSWAVGNVKDGVNVTLTGRAPPKRDRVGQAGAAGLRERTEVLFDDFRDTYGQLFVPHSHDHSRPMVHVRRTKELSAR